ncbi:MAG: hypothetical protein LUD47_06200 [Clostridia bacterium]|nr:hypothetical protein [Clostridia bacterium]
MAVKKTPRPWHLHVMLSDSEYAKFKTLVEKSGLSKREFVTRAILDKKIIVFNGWNDIIHQLTKLGNNYDQTLTNVYMGMATAEDLKKVSDRIDELIEYIHKILRGSISDADIHSEEQ